MYDTPLYVPLRRHCDLVASLTAPPRSKAASFTSGGITAARVYTLQRTRLAWRHQLMRIE